MWPRHAVSEMMIVHTFLWSGITAFVLLYTIAAAVRVRKEIKGEWLLILA